MTKQQHTVSRVYLWVYSHRSTDDKSTERPWAAAAAAQHGNVIITSRRQQAGVQHDRQAGALNDTD